MNQLGAARTQCRVTCTHPGNLSAPHSFSNRPVLNRLTWLPSFNLCPNQARSRSTDMDFVGTWQIYEMKCGMRTISIWRFKLHWNWLKQSRRFSPVAGGLHGRVVDDWCWRSEEISLGLETMNAILLQVVVGQSKAKYLRGWISDHQGDDSTF